MYLVKASILLSFFAGLSIAPVRAADEPCLTSINSSQPLGDQIAGGASVANSLLCEQGGGNLTIRSEQTFKDLNVTVASSFCTPLSSQTVSESPADDLCFDGHRYNYSEHTHYFSQFVEAIASDLSTQINEVPSNFQSQGLSDQEIRAMMLICTHYQIQKLGDILNSDSTLDEKQAALEQLVSLGLLTHFIHSDVGTQFLANPDSPLEFRTTVFKRYLETAGENRSLVLSNLENIVFILEEEDLFKEGEVQMARTAGQAIREYMEAPVPQQNMLVLGLLGQAEVEGAEAALQRFSENHEGAHAAGGMGGPALHEGRAPASESTVVADNPLVPQQNYPNCELINLDDFEESDYALSNHLAGPVLTSFASDETNTDFPARRPYQETWRWHQEIFNQEDILDWYNLETRMMTTADPINALINLRQYYCFNQRITRDFNAFQEQVAAGNPSPENANSIFQYIMEKGASKDHLSLIKELYPYLNEDNKRDAIGIVKFALLNTTSSEATMLRRWRLQTLEEWLAPHSNYSNGHASLILQAISYEGLVEEEATLARLFSEASTEENRTAILGLYTSYSLTASTGGNLDIIQAIQSIENSSQRAAYVDQLRESLGRVGVFGFNQGNQASNTVGRVPVEAMRSTLQQMIAMTTDADLIDRLESDIESRIEETQGVIDSGVANDELPIVPSIGSGSGITVIPDSNEKTNTAIGDMVGTLRPTRRPRNSEDRNLVNVQPPVGSAQGSVYNQIRDQKLSALEAQNDEEDSAQGPAEVLDEGQNNFFSTLGNALGIGGNNRPKQPAAPAFAPVQAPPVVGENSVQRAPAPNPFNGPNNGLGNSGSLTDSIDSSSDTSSNSVATSPRPRRNSNQDIRDEIRQISEDTSSLRREIDSLDDSPLGARPSAPVVAENSTSDSNGFNGSDPSPSRRAPGATTAASSGNLPRSGNIPNSGANGRSPSSAGAANGVANNGGPNPFSNGLLAPYDDPTQEDLDKIIQISSEEEKNLLMNYMAANEEMSCPELRFIQNFYDQNVDKFILSKRRRPWREYALLELDGMNFRFNYPGTVVLRQKIDETCANLAGREQPREVGEGSRAPASISEPVAQDVELVPDQAQPATQEKGLIKKFMLKLGL